jgi:hypothetical protein
MPVVADSGGGDIEIRNKKWYKKSYGAARLFYNIRVFTGPNTS